jgi:recombination-promoting nuclease RpnB
VDNQQQWSASSHQLADKFFKKALSNIEVARDFFAHHLPEGLQAGLDFASLRFMHNSFIDDDFYKKEADVLYSALIAGHPTYLYLLCEQQSEPDRWLAFRLLVYMVRIMEFHHKNKPGQPLPLVYPLVLYTGTTPWKGPLDVRQLLDAPSALIERYFLQPVSIIQGLTTTSEEMAEHAWSGTLAWVMSHIKVRDMIQHAKHELWHAFAILDEHASMTYLKDIL